MAHIIHIHYTEYTYSINLSTDSPIIIIIVIVIIIFISAQKSHISHYDCWLTVWSIIRSIAVCRGVNPPNKILG